MKSDARFAIIALRMKLVVENFALIKHAEIAIDGITVITGDNDSGKSTVGKILFSIFAALGNIESKIEEQKLRMIRKIVAFRIYRIAGEDSELRLWRLERDLRDYMSSNEGKIGIDWPAFTKKYADVVPELEQKRILEEMQQAIAQVETWPRSRLIIDAINPYFSSCFNQQINSLSSPELPAEVSMRIKNKEISMTFVDNSVVKINSEIKLENKAIFYSSPIAVDVMDETILDNLPMQHLIRLLRNYSYRMTDNSDLLEKSMLQETVGAVFERMNAVLPGKIQKERRGYGLYRKGWKEPLSIKNLSMGLKAFVILKMLLESNQLREKDVLILDEPEIHLHPTWQLVYAELVLLLQKKFDLSVVITTHSNFFLDAIETYAKKHNIRDKLHLYFAEQKDDAVEMRDVTDKPEAIYGRMADALDVLDSERLSME